jgi:hypothetical protein
MDMSSFEHLFTGKRIKNKNLTDVSIFVKECKPQVITNGWGPDEVDRVLELEVVWMNDLYEMEIGSDTLYIHPETLTEWYIYEPIKQASE